MHNSPGMGGIEGIGDFDAEVEKPLQFQGAAEGEFAERLAFQVLHHDEWTSLAFSNLVNGADVGVIER